MRQRDGGDGRCITCELILWSACWVGCSEVQWGDLILITKLNWRSVDVGRSRVLDGWGERWLGRSLAVLSLSTGDRCSGQTQPWPDRRNLSGRRQWRWGLLARGPTPREAVSGPPDWGEIVAQAGGQILLIFLSCRNRARSETRR